MTQDDWQRERARLQRRITDLEAEVREWKLAAQRKHSAHAHIILKGISLNQTEMNILDLLMRQNTVSWDAIMEARTRRIKDIGNRGQRDIVFGVISRLRKKIRPHGMEIEALWGCNAFSISEATRAVVQKLRVMT